MQNTESTLSESTRKRGIVRRFGGNKRGSVAIEFAMLAMPFFLLVFAIIENCISFAAGQMLQTSVDRVSRELRTNLITAVEAQQPGFIHDEICRGMWALVSDHDCPELFVDLQTYEKFEDIPPGVTRTASGDVDDAGFGINPGPRQSINQLRAFYRWTILADAMKYWLENMDRGSGNGKLLLFATMTWRNESS
jgi:Flp pilus assembly protein TadG